MTRQLFYTDGTPSRTLEDDEPGKVFSMTPEDVRKAVDDISAMQEDYEIAHEREDALYLRLLEAIAKGECKDPAACAAIAIETQKIEFGRWCA